jgi:isopentenyldiphosphate isomerase
VKDPPRSNLFISQTDRANVLSVPLDFNFGGLYKLILPHDPRPHGFLSADIVKAIPWTATTATGADESTITPFTITHATRSITIHPVGAQDLARDSPVLAAKVTAVLQTIVDNIVAADSFGITRGCHSEHFRIMGYAPGGLHATLERYTLPLFGMCSRSAHMTCYVRDPVSRASAGIWIARRSKTTFAFAHMLDNTVAGGAKTGQEPLDCISTEAAEEAGLDADWVRERAVSAGAVTYVSRSTKRDRGVSPSVLYVYDLELGADMVPRPTDGEVEAFHLAGIEEIRLAMHRQQFKPNCNLVMLDFFVRHGILTPENEPDYLDIVARLRRRLPVPLQPL